MLEMYVQGVSTRRVKNITEELCGHEFSSATISRMVGQLDSELEKFAQRPLEEPYPYLVSLVMTSRFLLAKRVFVLRPVVSRGFARFAGACDA